jgi:hypothetical protein
MRQGGPETPSRADGSPATSPILRAWPHLGVRSILRELEHDAAVDKGCVAAVAIDYASDQREAQAVPWCRTSGIAPGEPVERLVTERSRNTSAFVGDAETCTPRV